MEQPKKYTKSQFLTVHQLVKEGKQALEDCHKENAHIDSELLAFHVLGYTRLELILNYNLEVSKEDQAAYKECISKRCSGIPLQ